MQKATIAWSQGTVTNIKSIDNSNSLQTFFDGINRGENELIEDLSADLLSAVAPTPKSMYRTSGGYHNMAFSGRFNPENPVKSRRVWSGFFYLYCLLILECIIA